MITRRADVSESPGPLIKPAEAAAWLGIGPRTLASLVARGRLRYIDVGNGTIKIRRMYDLADLRAYVDANRKVATPCLSKKGKDRRSGTIGSNAEVVAFSDLQRQRTAAMPKR